MLSRRWNIWATSSERVPSKMRKMCGFTSSCTRAVSSGNLPSVEIFYSIHWLLVDSKFPNRTRADWFGLSLSAHDPNVHLAWWGSYINPCQAEYIRMTRPLLIFSQSDYLIQVVDINQILNGKQCRSRSIGFQLIWSYTVCKGRAYPG